MKALALSLALLLCPLLAPAQESAAQVTDVQLADYQLGLEAGCRSSGRRRGDSPTKIEAYCGCVMKTLRDNVTGLYQKMHFEDQLRREVDLSSRQHREFSLVSIELDPPSEEVKAMGAEAHARILEALGRLLRGNTRAMDASCRLDNSRFALSADMEFTDVWADTSRNGVTARAPISIRYTGNTNAASIMTGWKGASMVLEDQG